MSVSEILQSKGIKLKIIGNELSLSPKEKVTTEILQFAKAHKQTIMAELKNVIYHNPYPQGTPEARQESLMQCMEATWQEAFRSVKETYEGKQRQFKTTPHILILEQKVGALQQAVLKGEANLKDFQLTAYEWERASKAELN